MMIKEENKMLVKNDVTASFVFIFFAEVFPIFQILIHSLNPC